MGKKEKSREELPDYTVADMDLEGMPWNSRRLWQLTPGDPAKWRRMRRSAEDSVFQRKGGGPRGWKADRENRKGSGAGDAACVEAWDGRTASAGERAEGVHNGLSAREMWSLAWQGLKAGLLVGGIFAAAGLIFLLFCVFVWFR